MSWFTVAPGAPFGTEELPYGIFSTPDSPGSSDGRRRVGVAVGNRVLDLAAVAGAAGLDAEVFEQTSLNALMSLGPDAWAEGRQLLQALLADGWVKSTETAGKLLDELLRAHARHLPQFA